MAPQSHRTSHKTPLFISNIETDYMEKMLRESCLTGINLWAGRFQTKTPYIDMYREKMEVHDNGFAYYVPAND